VKILSVVMVGTGGFADIHAQRWMKVDGVKIVAVIGRDHKKTSLFAERYGIEKFYSDFSRFRAEVTDFDILDVVTVPSAHIDTALEFMDGCKGFFIEKPIDIDVRRALTFLNMVRNKKIFVGVVSQLKYGDAYHRIRELVKGGDLGKIIHFIIHLSNLRESDYYCSNGGWRDDLSISGGGVMMSQAIHRLNFVLSIVGYDVDEVSAFEGMSRYAKNVDESISVVFKMKQGYTGSLCATSIAGVESDYVIFEGTDGVIATDFKDYNIIKKGREFSLSKLLTRFHGKSTVNNKTEEDLLYNQMCDFITIVREKSIRQQNLIEAINDLIIIKAIYESAAKRCSVRVGNIVRE
jgi:predicted dehydrogenase